MSLSEKIKQMMRDDIILCSGHAEISGSEALYNELVARYCVLYPDFEKNLLTNGKIAFGSEFDYRPELKKIASKLNMYLEVDESLSTKNDVQSSPVEISNGLYDVFISHANIDKKDYVDDLKQSLDKLKIRIFYDKESIEWGDKWKDKILDGVNKAEFAIIVISENFFDREWTEAELKEFLSRQNSCKQKIILPILHNITIDQLTEHYPSIADIQAIDSSECNCDEIALLFARQLIHRLKENR